MLTKSCTIAVDTTRRCQTIDGFGVNINGRCWDNGERAPVVDMLIDDLGATLFRLDVYGKSNWVDPDGALGRERALSRANLDRVYASTVFQNGLGMARHLNSRGIEPYVTLSGIVPPWMCAADGKTLADVDSYCAMATDFASWLRRSGVRFHLFGPQNETDLGPPEGPCISPQAFVDMTRTLAKQFDQAGLSDVKLVVAEQARFGHAFIEPFNNAPDLRGRIAALGMHTYADNEPVTDVVGRWEAGPHQDAPVWMTEYGDLDQTGEQEYYFAWVILRRLFHLLKGGMNAALNWDAFDNYHDHDEAWTIYGLIRTGLRTSTPRKRYYACKHVYRFARPGCVRVECGTDIEGVDALAFHNKDGGLAVVGMNDRPEALRMIVRPEGMSSDVLHGQGQGWLTTDQLNCAGVEVQQFRPWTTARLGWQIDVPPQSVFTVTAGWADR
jgi:O-glycosyl hydrolase